VVLRVE